MKAKDETALADVIASASSRTRPVAVLLVGLVGAGKTTFLNYTRKVAARELFEDKSHTPRPHWIYIDFRNLAPEESTVNYLYAEMKRHIQSDSFLASYDRCVKHAYRDEIESLFSGPMFLLAEDEAERRRRVTDLLMADYTATIPYVDKVLSYAARNAPVFIVIDGALVNYSSRFGFQHLDGDLIKSNLRTIGFGDDVTLAVLADLCRYRFAFTASHASPTLTASFLPSRLGGYVVRVLLGDLMFLENVMMDTFIPDETVWRSLRELTAEIYGERDILRRLRIRKQRAEVFFAAMREMYAPLYEESVRRGLSAEWCGHPLQAIEPQFHGQLRYALRSADRNYSQPSGSDLDEAEA